MKPLNLRQNKKGNIVVIAIFIIVLFVIMFAGFIMVVGSGLLKNIVCLKKRNGTLMM